jgi:hypothetical protein
MALADAKKEITDEDIKRVATRLSTEVAAQAGGVSDVVL